MPTMPYVSICVRTIPAMNIQNPHNRPVRLAERVSTAPPPLEIPTGEYEGNQNERPYNDYRMVG